MTLEPLPAAAPGPETLAGLWNAACGPGLALTARLVACNLTPATGTALAAQLLRVDGRPAGCVIASAVTQALDGLPHPAGWIEALVVAPEFQRRGIGRHLLAWAEDWLRSHGCPTARLGGGLRPFVPGVPVETGSEAFFVRQGYAPRAEESRVWDVASDLTTLPPAPQGKTDFVERGKSLEVRPLQAVDVPAMDAFLACEFPGRWQYEFREQQRQGGRLEDTLALWGPSDVLGFCQLTLEDSLRPIERFYPHGLPRPWGQLGPIGVGAGQRGRGLGGRLLQAGLDMLRARGVAGCVIDWTSLPAFYQKYGFHIHREYHILLKGLA